MLYDSTINLVVVVFLLAANAFFVAAEFALVKACEFRIDHIANEGGIAARLTRDMQGNLESYLAACQLGITMASLGLGWVGEPAVEALLRPLLEPLELSEKTLHTVSFLSGFIIFSSLHIVVGEQVPKTFAIRKPEPVSIWCAIPLRIFYVLFFPLTWTLNWASRAMLRAMGINEAPHMEILSGTEIKGLVTTSAQHGELSEGKAEMIHNVFRFDERSVGRVMIPRVDCDALHLDHSPEKNIAIMKDTRHSRFPVVEGSVETLVGIVLMKDLVDAMLSGVATPWTDLRAYCREPMVIPETLKVSRLFDKMRAARAHMACVVDEYGTFVGVITLEDLIEEIVGDISDETDNDFADFHIEAGETGWSAHGLASLADVERETGLEVADDLNANTLSGLFMSRLERMPKVGDTLVEGGYRLTVDVLKDRHVEKVRIEKDGEGDVV